MSNLFTSSFEQDEYNKIKNDSDKLKYLIDKNKEIDTNNFIFTNDAFKEVLIRKVYESRKKEIERLTIVVNSSPSPTPSRSASQTTPTPTSTPSRTPSPPSIFDQYKLDLRQDPYLDALIYSKTNNILTVNEVQTNITDINTNNFSTEIPKILDLTSLKRACCNNTETDDANNLLKVKVKIPQPKDFSNDNLTFYNKKYKYIEKEILVPKSLCNIRDVSYVKYNQTCDRFMNVYCNNEYKRFNNMIEVLGEKINESPNTKFDEYLPECSCFTKIDNPNFDNFNIPKNCIIKGCSKSKGAYLDKSSRKNENPPIAEERDCSIVNCQSILQIDNIRQDDNSNFGLNSGVSQRCGLNNAENENTTTQTRNPSSPTTPIRQIDTTTTGGGGADSGQATRSPTTSPTKAAEKDNTTLYLIIALVICMLCVCMSLGIGSIFLLK